jgi:alpha-ketoglutarate-dependent taurine dioxygenase
MFLSLVAGSMSAPRVAFAQQEPRKVALYANVGADLTHYDVDVAGAALTKRATVSLPAGVQYAWPHVSRRYLYVATSSSASGYGAAGTAAVLGAEIAGVDLSQPLDDVTFAAIERAYNEYGVIFFRGQSISPARQVAFTRRFGEIEFNIFGERGTARGVRLSRTQTILSAHAGGDRPQPSGPIVRRHPSTGRECLYVMRDDCTGIEGMEPDEAEALIAALADHIVKPAFVYRHQWRPGDVLMWDNCMVQHRAIQDYDMPQRRLMHRTTMGGAVPA